MNDDTIKSELESLGWTIHQLPEGHFDFPLVRAEKRVRGEVRDVSASTFATVLENVRRIEASA